jgi:hypothetical protein
MMDFSVAKQAGITPSDLDSLFNGKAYASVANRLGISMAYIEDYINRNSASADLAACLGFSMSAAEQLGEKLSRSGRIGLIVGVLIAK